MNNPDEDLNPLTVEQRREIQTLHRGKLVGVGEWRNFCCKCGMPLIVHREWLRGKDDLTCDECRPSIQVSNQMSTAFSPDRRTSK